MKAEPLKGKHFSIDDRFKREDIRSAVEWLKTEIAFLASDKYKGISQKTYVKLLEKLDKAFEDVMK